MPCDCSHLEPRYYEKESRKVAQLIVYVTDNLGLETSKEAKEASQHIYGDEEMIHQFTAELCRLCKEMTDEQAAKIIWDGRNRQARRLADWWEKHQAADKQKAEKKAAGSHLS